MDRGRQVVDEAWRHAAALEPAAVVLVEGASDHAAVVALAGRLGRDLAGERTAVVPMEGFSGIGRFLARYGPGGTGRPAVGPVRPQRGAVLRRRARAGGLG